MDKKLYKDTIDSIRISDEAVEKAIKNLKQPDAVGKVIKMKKSKHRFIKSIGAVAAALALIIGAGAIFNLGSVPEQGTSNSFFITANAAATDDEAVRITNEFTTIGSVKPKLNSICSRTPAPDAPERVANITVDADFNFNCVGDNVKTITYKVNNGDFDGVICLHDNNKKIVDYGIRNKNFHGGSKSMGKYGFTYECLFYDYVTVNYDRQLNISDDLSGFSVYYEPATIEEAIMMQNFLNDFDRFSDIPDMSLKEAKKRIKEFYHTIFRNTEVVITATYKDGSAETKSLKLAVDKIAVYDGQDGELKDETRVYKNIYNYDLIMTAKLV